MADVWLIIAAVWFGVPLAVFLVSFTVVALAIRSGRKASRDSLRRAAESVSSTGEEKTDG